MFFRYFTIMVIVVTGFGCSVGLTPFDQQAAERFRTHTLLPYFSAQQSVNKPLTLYDVMARVLTYNSKHRTAVLQRALQWQEVKLSRHDLLPTVVAESGYSERNKFDIRDTRDLQSGDIIPNPTSVSSEKNKLNFHLGFSWDIIDFALNMVRGGQARGEFLVTRERRKLAAIQLLSEVQENFWGAYTAQRYEPLFAKLEQELRDILSDLNAVETQTVIPKKSLEQQRDLLKVMRKIIDLRTELLKRKVLLANLMGLPPNTDYRLTPPAQFIPFHTHSVTELDRMALNARPELKLVSYETTIDLQNTTQQLLRLFPSLSVDSGFYETTDDLVVNSRWNTLSVDLSWRLLSLFKLPALIRSKRLKKQLQEQRQLTIAMGLLMQNRLAQVNYQQLLEAYAADLQLHLVEKQLSHLTDSGQQLSVSFATPVDVIRDRLNLMVSALDRSESYGRLQRSYFDILRSAGFDLMPSTVPDDSLDTLAQHLEKHLQKTMGKGRLENQRTLLNNVPETHPNYLVFDQVVSNWRQETQLLAQENLE